VVVRLPTALQYFQHMNLRCESDESIRPSLNERTQYSYRRRKCYTLSSIENDLLIRKHIAAGFVTRRSVQDVWWESSESFVVG
jgi:hypothetical protein